jgi:hypothetical protein
LVDFDLAYNPYDVLRAEKQVFPKKFILFFSFLFIYIPVFKKLFRSFMLANIKNLTL